MNLTVTKSTNQREVEMMFGKAMCAYANWHVTDEDSIYLATIYGDAMVDRSIMAHKSEYEATARCIAMFVDESLPRVCKAVIDAAESEFNL